MYSKGQGVARDYVKAIAWFREAAEQVDATAQHCLGQVCNKGEGVPEENNVRLRWWPDGESFDDGEYEYPLTDSHENMEEPFRTILKEAVDEERTKLLQEGHEDRFRAGNLIGRLEFSG
jgi:TPR repeat protein